MRSTRRSSSGLNRFRFFSKSRTSRRAVPDRRHGDRRQKVRFRRRAATARLKIVGEALWVTSRIAIVAGVVVWGAGLGWNAWKSAEFFRITNVRFEGDVPPRLPGTIPVRAGIGIFSFSASDLEAEAKRRYPELGSLDVSRRFDRGLTIRGRYRTPMAMVVAPIPTAISADGTTFAVPASMTVPSALPVIDAPVRQRAELVETLHLWQKKVPAFFEVVKKLETDKVHSFHVELSDGVTVDWGDLEPDSSVEKARNVLRLMEFFSPGRTPARLRFVTQDRIVMDASWQSAGSKTSGEDHLVKT